MIPSNSSDHGENAREPIHPGEILLEEFLKPMGISQYRLAEVIHVPRRRINEIVHGTRRITPKARSAVLDCDRDE